MNENRRKWLLDLHEKGFRFNEYHDDLAVWMENSELLDFTRDLDCYRIPAQPIPDIPDWRELCREMHDRGIKFEHHAWAGIWGASVGLFDSGRENYRIPQQPIPEWKEEMTEETKPDPREEILHHELQVQWHEDKLHSLRTREPMREWEYRLKNGDGEWKICHDPHFSEKYEYRRKPRTVKYWHCLYEHTQSGFINTESSLTALYTNMTEFKETIAGEDCGNKVLACFEQTVELAD